ncbi:MAG: AMP-dependent synthetase [Nevskiaceae bacterium]|nr:MAG: AMP-dependent synthetase [Nevskiaceae bacterium]TBR73116.1 MAG: AMP-dependent synthetase [Nevskiaceae bacterium]
MNETTQAFRQARDTLIRYRDDYAAARRHFEWPHFEHFNWALDYFDDFARDNDRTALIVAGDDGTHQATFAQLRTRSNQVANLLRRLGVKRGDPVILMLDNEIPLWETLLAAIKLGTPFIPCSVLLTQADLEERMQRSGARHVVTSLKYVDRFANAKGVRVCTSPGTAPSGWIAHTEAYRLAEEFKPDAPTPADAPMIFYFTSGTTSKPKLVVHTHTSYPIGHLSTMYWVGIRPGGVHLNLSSPGWAKHAWSSLFAPWNAEATIVATNMARFDAVTLLQCLSTHKVSSFCAPPTVWRMLIQQDLAQWRSQLNLAELVSAGEPLNPEVIERVRKAWGLTIRDGYGQTETTATIANTPGQILRAGSVGRPLPGFTVELLDAEGQPAEEGEVCLALHPQRPVGLMAGYLGNPKKTDEVMRGGYYHTGDVAMRDADGGFTYVGRADDVFKSSDYRISPFELESVMVAHAQITEAAVVPSPDPLRTSVPKAFVTVAAGVDISEDFAHGVFIFTRRMLAPYKRIRRIQFVAELPKTVSGKIRRVQLRAEEAQRRALEQRAENEFLEEDFPTLKQEVK